MCSVERAPVGFSIYIVRKRRGIMTHCSDGVDDSRIGGVWVTHHTESKTEPENVSSLWDSQQYVSVSAQQQSLRFPVQRAAPVCQRNSRACASLRSVQLLCVSAIAQPALPCAAPVCQCNSRACASLRSVQLLCVSATAEPALPCAVYSSCVSAQQQSLRFPAQRAAPVCQRNSTACASLRSSCVSAQQQSLRFPAQCTAPVCQRNITACASLRSVQLMRCPAHQGDPAAAAALLPVSGRHLLLSHRARVHCACSHCARVHCACSHCARVHCACSHCARFHCACSHCARFKHTRHREAPHPPKG
ncbi:hypothetical protein JZ751_006208, partial [Albula glossodonta]